MKGKDDKRMKKERMLWRKKQSKNKESRRIKIFLKGEKKRKKKGKRKDK